MSDRNLDHLHLALHEQRHGADVPRDPSLLYSWYYLPLIVATAGVLGEGLLNRVWSFASPGFGFIVVYVVALLPGLAVRLRDYLVLRQGPPVQTGAVSESGPCAVQVRGSRAELSQLLRLFATLRDRPRAGCFRMGLRRGPIRVLWVMLFGAMSLLLFARFEIVTPTRTVVTALIGLGVILLDRMLDPQRFRIEKDRFQVEAWCVHDWAVVAQARLDGASLSCDFVAGGVLLRQPDGADVTVDLRTLWRPLAFTATLIAAYADANRDTEPVRNCTGDD